MNAKNLMSANMGSASIQMVPIAASVPLVTFWKGMNVWVSNKLVSSIGILQIRNQAIQHWHEEGYILRWGRNKCCLFIHVSFMYQYELSPHWVPGTVLGNVAIAVSQASLMGKTDTGHIWRHSEKGHYYNERLVKYTKEILMVIISFSQYVKYKIYPDFITHSNTMLCMYPV